MCTKAGLASGAKDHSSYIHPLVWSWGIWYSNYLRWSSWECREGHAIGGDDIEGPFFRPGGGKVLPVMYRFSRMCGPTVLAAAPTEMPAGWLSFVGSFPGLARHAFSKKFLSVPGGL